MAERRIDIPNAKTPFDGVLVGGQPTTEQLQAAKDAGYRTIVNLRPLSEQSDWDEATQVDQLGMDYVHIPVASSADLTPEAAEQLAEALQKQPTMVHCASGNRVGALFAIKAKLVDGEDTESAVATGKRAGMTHSEPDVRQLLD